MTGKYCYLYYINIFRSVNFHIIYGTYYIILYDMLDNNLRNLSFHIIYNWLYVLKVFS